MFCGLQKKVGNNESKQFEDCFMTCIRDISPQGSCKFLFKTTLSKLS